MSDILICDGSNLFVRAFFSASDAILTNAKGQDTTAIYVFLRSLRMIIDKEKPEQVYIIFDFGRDVRKKQIYKEYKANRNIDLGSLAGYDLTIKMNEIESRKRQKDVIIDILKTLPLKLVILRQIEGDSLIAYVSKYFSNIDKTITIVSNDKDFYQLLSDEKIKIYNPHKKQYIAACNMEEIFPVKNLPIPSYRVYKSIRGDNSDNIKGINKFGDKKIQKMFDLCGDNKPTTIKDLYKEFESNEELKKKFWRYFEESRELLERNYELVDLIDIDFSPQSISIIYKIIDSPVSFSKMKFLELLMKENINTILEKTEKFIQPFNKLLSTK